MRYFVRLRGQDEISGPFTLAELESHFKVGTLTTSHLALEATNQTAEQLKEYWNFEWVAISAVPGMECHTPAILKAPKLCASSSANWRGAWRRGIISWGSGLGNYSKNREPWEVGVGFRRPMPAAASRLPAAAAGPDRPPRPAIPRPARTPARAPTAGSWPRWGRSAPPASAA